MANNSELINRINVEIAALDGTQTVEELDTLKLSAVRLGMDTTDIDFRLNQLAIGGQSLNYVAKNILGNTLGDNGEVTLNHLANLPLKAGQETFIQAGDSLVYNRETSEVESARCLANNIIFGEDDTSGRDSNVSALGATIAVPLDTVGRYVMVIMPIRSASNSSNVYINYYLFDRNTGEIVQSDTGRYHNMGSFSTTYCSFSQIKRLGDYEYYIAAISATSAHVAPLHYIFQPVSGDFANGFTLTLNGSTAQNPPSFSMTLLVSGADRHVAIKLNATQMLNVHTRSNGASDVAVVHTLNTNVASTINNPFGTLDGDRYLSERGDALLYAADNKFVYIHAPNSTIYLISYNGVDAYTIEDSIVETYASTSYKLCAILDGFTLHYYYAFNGALYTSRYTVDTTGNTLSLDVAGEFLFDLGIGNLNSSSFAHASLSDAGLFMETASTPNKNVLIKYDSQGIISSDSKFYVTLNTYRFAYIQQQYNGLYANGLALDNDRDSFAIGICDLEIRARAETPDDPKYLHIGVAADTPILGSVDVFCYNPIVEAPNMPDLLSNTLDGFSLFLGGKQFVCPNNFSGKAYSYTLNDKPSLNTTNLGDVYVANNTSSYAFIFQDGLGETDIKVSGASYGSTYVFSDGYLEHTSNFQDMCSISHNFSFGMYKTGHGSGTFQAVVDTDNKLEIK